jgi:FkbM family methyltransferase
MKMIHGWCLPDGDKHFEEHLRRGSGTYQDVKRVAAVAEVSTNRRRLALDIGAHVGLWTSPLAFEFDRVLAFEPVPEFVECWHANIVMPNTTLIECALGDRSSSVAICRHAENSGNAHVDPAGGGGLPMLRLDELELENIDFVKIDTEGYELPVIVGGLKTIKRCKPFMIVEQKPNNAERYGFGQFAAIELLTSIGARVLWSKSGDYCLGWK